MHTESRNSFAFLVITYNHEKYILEHLESIKYQAINYGKDIDIDLIISDDLSKDRTRALIDTWLNSNNHLFRSVERIYNSVNMGTCTSVNNLLSKLKANSCKITAGDDVYSFENIFTHSNRHPDAAIISGRPLYLTGNILENNLLSDILATATQIIYRDDKPLHRFKHFSNNNAPNILYKTDCLLNNNVRSYLKKFDVTEDWPLQISIAREFPNRKFHLIDEVLVYYRRTPGSTYIVANKRFIKDKISIYNDLIENENSPLERLRLKSRKACFTLKNRIAKKIFNIDFYIFAISFLSKLHKIAFAQMAVNLKTDKHKNHYQHIKSEANNFLNLIKTDV